MQMSPESGRANGLSPDLIRTLTSQARTVSPNRLSFSQTSAAAGDRGSASPPAPAKPVFVRVPPNPPAVVPLRRGISAGSMSDAIGFSQLGSQVTASRAVAVPANNACGAARQSVQPERHVHSHRCCGASTCGLAAVDVTVCALPPQTSMPAAADVSLQHAVCVACAGRMPWREW